MGFFILIAWGFGPERGFGPSEKVEHFYKILNYKSISVLSHPISSHNSIFFTPSMFGIENPLLKI
jgi:hypothetical protein